MTVTIDNEKLIKFCQNKKNVEEVSDVCINFKVNLFPRESTDEEFADLSHKLGLFAFWDDESEDIYSPSDGRPIE